ncbi:MAG: proline iminopeptidase [Candidatus Saccharibacteria bacterium]|nr:proline iminopeptidase [Candidatus Saccharibacteria bacterium]
MTPDKYTNETLMLDVGDGHQLSVHDWGNKDAKTPIVYLQGGPGGATSDRKKLLFDPLAQRVIFYDQRGAGKSLPYGSLEHNTTQDLVADIITILNSRGIERCILVGGSWGSTLALCFGIAHPDRVAAMVIDGVWTSTKAENSWLDQGGFKTFFPDVWDAYVATVPKANVSNPSAYHFQRILGNDLETATQSAIAYTSLEGGAISLDDRHEPINSDEYDPSALRIEVHYLNNLCFIPDNYIFDHVGKLTMPIAMVQGRYDMVCPPHTAYKLSKLLRNAQLHFTTSGHAAEHESWSLIKLLVKQFGEA